MNLNVQHAWMLSWAQGDTEVAAVGRGTYAHVYNRK
jgi:hypothetical protein